MKSFFTSLLATVVGIILSTFILVLIFAGIVGAISASKDKAVELKDNTILYLKFDQPVLDRKPTSPFDFARFSKNEQIGLNDLLECIEKAKTDEKIAGIYIEPGYSFAGLATIDEIRTALVDFRSSGKFVVSYSNDLMSQPALYLSSVSDKVFLNPVGMLLLNGLSLQTMHVKNALDKLDIKTEVIKIGEYKGAGEMFEFDKMSPENQAQLDRIVNTIWDNMAEDICQSRSISKDTLNYLVSTLGIKDPTYALKYGLVDSLIYKGDVIKYLKTLTQIAEKDDLNTVELSKYSKVPGKKNFKGVAREKIAVIYASGTIVDGEGEESNIGGENFARAIREARRDSTIKAIVLRVNSGGGSAMASEDILVELLETKGVKPIVVSMGDVAGSGGYYIACAADTILSGKNTITGSIGVLGVFLNAEGFFNRLGLTFDVSKSHTYADFMSQNKPLKPEEKVYLQHFIEITYDQFITHVAEGRNMTKEEVNEIGRGHVYSGSDAKDINLIDNYGGLKDAIAVAHRMANLGEKYRIVDLPKQPDPIEQFVKEITGEAQVKSMLRELGIKADTYQQAKDLIQTQGIVALMPFMIQIK